MKGGRGRWRRRRVPSREEHPVAGRSPHTAGLRVEEAELVLQRRLHQGVKSGIQQEMVNGLHFIQRFSYRRPLKALYNVAHIHPFIHTFTHRRRCQPRRVTASSSGAVRVSSLALLRDTSTLG